MSEMLQSLTNAEKARIAHTARRRLSSEITLILTAGFAVIMVTLFVFGNQTFIPLAEAIGIKPTRVWFALAALLSASWALLHRQLAGPKILRAQRLDGELKDAYWQQRQKEQNEKIKTMQGKD